MYQYRAIITAVYDGDTVTANIDLGLDVWLHGVKLRLLGIDAPEIRTKNLTEKALAILARDRLRELVLHKEVVLIVKGKGKFGRWLSHILLSEEDVAKQLLNEGLVSLYDK